MARFWWIALACARVRGWRRPVARSSTGCNLVARDILMAEHIRHEADSLGLPMVSVDTDSLAGIAAVIEQHFASQLPGVR